MTVVHLYYLRCNGCGEVDDDTYEDRREAIREGKRALGGHFDGHGNGLCIRCSTPLPKQEVED